LLAIISAGRIETSENRGYSKLSSRYLRIRNFKTADFDKKSFN